MTLDTCISFIHYIHVIGAKLKFHIRKRKGWRSDIVKALASCKPALVILHVTEVNIKTKEEKEYHLNAQPAAATHMTKS